MTPKLKFDLIRPTQFQDFHFFKIFCLSTPWSLKLRFKSFLWFSQHLEVTQSDHFSKVVLTFEDLPKLFI